MSSDRAPPERPAGEETAVADDEPDNDSDDGSDDETETINYDPGARKASGDRGVERMIIEAELVADGHEPDNPAIPASVETGEKLRERLDEHEDDLVPAWTRPWEGADE